jgi:hypothetical protein
MQTPEEIITDAEIERVHANANFGHMSKRRVVDEGVLKYAFGWSTGSTMRAILLEHGLIRARRPTETGSLTPKGKKYLRAMQGDTRVDNILDAMSGGKPVQHWKASRTVAPQAAEHGWAITYDATPGGRDNGDGTRSYSLIFPALLLYEHIEDPEGTAHRIADALNKSYRIT